MGEEPGFAGRRSDGDPFAEPAEGDVSGGDERGEPAGEDVIDEQGEESFPASDPPANWAGPEETGRKS